MADHIPFVTSVDVCDLVKKYYHDSEIIRIPLDRAEKFIPHLPHSAKVWIDPCVDGLDDLDKRRSEPGSKNSWFEFMSKFTNFQIMGSPNFIQKPVVADVNEFVKAVMNECASHNPTWITIPQIPLTKDSERNKINRELAKATRKWKSSAGFNGRLILPLVFTHQNQLNRKTERNPKVREAERCYAEAQADGFWVVDSSMQDDNGSKTLRNIRFPGIINLHEELNNHISTKIKITGPYWGLNIVLWARGLVDYPAIGVGAGYQYFLAGLAGIKKTTITRLALSMLRRRVNNEPQLQSWINSSIAVLAPSHPAYNEISDLRTRLTVLKEQTRAKEQIAKFYKQWYNIIASVPKEGRLWRFSKIYLPLMLLGGLCQP